MKPATEGNLKHEIQALRIRHGYSLGYRPIHVLLMKMGLSYSLYLVRRVMNLPGISELPKKRRYPKGNFSPESRKPDQRQFPIQDTSPEMVYRYHSEEIPERHDSILQSLKILQPGWWWVMQQAPPTLELIVKTLSTVTNQYTSTATIIHSDKVSNFESEHYQNAAKQAGLIQSMGNAGLSFAKKRIERCCRKIQIELLHTQLWKF